MSAWSRAPVHEGRHGIAVGFQTSWANHASRAAIARLGAKQDGVIRNHLRHADGSIRDTVTFPIIDPAWPAVKTQLQSKPEQYDHG